MIEHFTNPVSQSCASTRPFPLTCALPGATRPPRAGAGADGSAPVFVVKDAAVHYPIYGSCTSYRSPTGPAPRLFAPRARSILVTCCGRSTKTCHSTPARAWIWANRIPQLAPITSWCAFCTVSRPHRRDGPCSCKSIALTPSHTDTVKVTM